MAATGQLCPNTTQIPDLILDNLDSFSDTELRIVLCVARATLGWRKDRDWLTRTEVSRRTGRTGRAVSMAVDSLVERGILVVQGADGEILDTPAARKRVGESHRRLFFSLNVYGLVTIGSDVPLDFDGASSVDQGNNFTAGSPGGDGSDQGNGFPGPGKILPSTTPTLYNTQLPSERTGAIDPVPTVDAWKLIELPDEAAELRSAFDLLRQRERDIPAKERVGLLSQFLFLNLENQAEVGSLVIRPLVMRQIGQLSGRYSVPFLVWAFLSIRRVPIDEGPKVALFGPIAARYKRWCMMLNDRRAEAEARVDSPITAEELVEAGFRG